MGCPRERLLSALETLAPLRFAESWDNVGLIIAPDERVEFNRALITVDLTERVLAEAKQLCADFIVAYHPPVFAGLKRFRSSVPAERIVLSAISAGITVYSPHTALDAVSGGMTDWLASAAGPGRTRPIVPFPNEPHAGSGRLCRLENEVSIERAIELVKEHLNLGQLRVSIAEGSGSISTVAVCPGAGGSVLDKVKDVDLLITGEMRHHDVLARKLSGTHVILTDHTNSERGYLPKLARNVSQLCPELQLSVAEQDADPLEIV